MIKKTIGFLLSAVALICFSACSIGAPKIKCGVYRSETSDAYIEVFDDNTVQIVNCDLSVIERILEDDTIYMAELNESDSEDLRGRWDLNRDYVDNRVKYERDDEFYKYEGSIGLIFPLDNPYGVGCTTWGFSYYPAGEKIILEADGLVSDDHVSEIFVLEK